MKYYKILNSDGTTFHIWDSEEADDKFIIEFCRNMGKTWIESTKDDKDKLEESWQWKCKRAELLKHRRVQERHKKRPRCYPEP
jgi:hypothetical protein